MHVQPVALVTGANRGIGREICRQLNARGYHVLLTARDPAQGVAVAREMGLEFLPLDVTSPASVARLAASLARRKLGLDVLVHNAGVMSRHFDAEVARATLAVNYFGVLHLTEALLPHLRPRARVVIVSSGLGDRQALAEPLRARFADGALDRAELTRLMAQFVALAAEDRHLAAGWPSHAYAVSKIGATMLAQVLARELADDPRGLRVNALCPGWVKTAMGGEGAEREVGEGADTAVWLATEPPGSGGFYRDRQPATW
jgi:NAD(P)-dependent dehydrogenase (short-subunit alcohol dehydrogenase family)